jgi:hypothetical protein
MASRSPDRDAVPDPEFLNFLVEDISQPFRAIGTASRTGAYGDSKLFRVALKGHFLPQLCQIFVIS